LDFISRKYKYVIVDSCNQDVRDLQRFFDNNQNFNCVGIARSEDEALNLIIDLQPDLVFFDTDFEKGINSSHSFDFIHQLNQFLTKLPAFVALSTSTNYSYLAIKNEVFDYILKPLNYYDLKKMVMKFEKKNPKSTNNSICIKSLGEYRMLLIDEIIYLKADKNTTDFYLTDGTMVTSFKPLKKFESELPNVFTRIHKSYIVNIKYVAKIHFSKFYCVLKFTNKLIPFSKSLKSKMYEIRNSWQNKYMDFSRSQISLS
jgi:two-component system, LytTR family, response regulator